MKSLLGYACLAFFLNFGCIQDLAAQSLVITNARIIDGNGGVINRGAVVVRNGRIVSFSEGAAVVPGAVSIDAQGMTVMPGFIDSHRHVIQGDATQ